MKASTSSSNHIKLSSRPYNNLSLSQKMWLQSRCGMILAMIRILIINSNSAILLLLVVVVVVAVAVAVAVAAAAAAAEAVSPCVHLQIYYTTPAPSHPILLIITALPQKRLGASAGPFRSRSRRRDRDFW